MRKLYKIFNKDNTNTHHKNKSPLQFIIFQECKIIVLHTTTFHYQPLILAPATQKHLRKTLQPPPPLRLEKKSHLTSSISSKASLRARFHIYTRAHTYFRKKAAERARQNQTHARSENFSRLLTLSSARARAFRIFQ